MQVQKWIIAEETAMIVPLSQAIMDSNATDTGICWLPGSPDDLRLSGNIELFHQVLSTVPVAIGLELSSFAAMQEADQALDLIRYFFKVNYYKAGNVPMLFFFGPGSADPDQLYALIGASAADQGFERILLFPYEEDRKYNADFYAEMIREGAKEFDYEAFFHDWTDHCNTTNRISEPLIFIAGSTIAAILVILHSLQRNERILTDQNKFFKFSLLASGVQGHLLEKSLLLKGLEQDNKNKSGYVELHRAELIKILAWYDDQYEVLPLWYKRFGHIIKVIQGKRSFRSLFE